MKKFHQKYENNIKPDLKCLNLVVVIHRALKLIKYIVEEF